MKDILKFSFIAILIVFFILLVPVLFMKIFEFASFILGYISDIYKHFLIFCGMDYQFAILIAPVFLGFSLLIFFVSIFVFILTSIEERNSKPTGECCRSTSGRVRG